MHATLCDMITDLVHNSIEAGAKKITLEVEETDSNLSVVIADNGKGMNAETLEKAQDPFYTDGLKHKHRKVGLGLAFLYQTVEMTDGTVAISSQEGAGTTVSFSLDLAHIDLPEFGNFTQAAVGLISYGFEGDLTIRHRVNKMSYTANKAELTEVLGDLSEMESLILLRQFIEENEKNILDC
ncbi:MAG: ATP-binding protein [Pontiellaceae bacterium]|nr:ATP-binding protein [Pontiellaceae bacterium]